MSFRLSLGIGVVALALSLAAPVRAGIGLPVTADGQAAYEAADCEFQAVPHCGDTAAQYHLGLMFKDGNGVPKDPAAALGWFICAARSDGQTGIDAARWAGQLSSSLEGPSVLAAQQTMPGCPTLAEILPQSDTSEAFERPGGEYSPSDNSPSDNSSIWKILEFKLDRFLEALLRFDFSESDGNHSTDRTAAPETPKFRTQGFATVPDRRDVWSRAFFLPADGTIVGSQHIAKNLGADDMLRDLRQVARDRNDIVLGLIAILWWALIGKSLLSVGRVVFGPSRKSGARRLGQSGSIAPGR